MPKTKITDYSASQASNTDVGGVNIAEACQFGNINDAIRYVMAHLANMNAGTDPLADTVTFGDPADLTKRYRLDAGSVTAGATRVIAVPDTSGTMVLTSGAQALQSKTFADASDATKVLAFALSGITTGTTRTVTWPDANGTVMLGSQYPTAVSLEGLSLVAGDILYATAADTLQRLAKGTALQTLRMNAGATAPEWVDDSALVRIESKAASGATIAFTDLAAYSYIEMVFDGATFSGINQPFIRVSNDNGATYETGYAGSSSNDATGTTSTNEIFLVDGATVGAINGILKLHYFNVATEKTQVEGLMRVGDVGHKTIARRDTAETNNAILVSTSTGTMTAGTVTLWGRKR